MAWNIERRATDEDAIRLERAAQAFIQRNDLIPDLHAPHYYPAGNSAVGDLEDVLEAAISGDYPFDASEGRRLRRNWNRCVRRALRSQSATGIAWGTVGYHMPEGGDDVGLGRRDRTRYLGGVLVDEIRYPDVKVQLTGSDGNAYPIIGRVSTALRRAGVEPDTVREFIAEATAHDYDHLLRTCMKWVTVN